MNKLYIRLQCCLVLALPALFGKAQNLVPNPGFENGSCVVNYNSTPAKIPTTINNWYSCTGASPDPFDICGNAMPAAYDVFVPDVLFGYQYAHTGNRFMGFGFYSAWYEYLGVKLTAPLEAGETYHVTFWLSCGDLMSWAADQVGIYFSTTDISYPTTSTYGGMLNYTPQIVNTTGNFITDTTWQKVSGDFVAAGGEQYIVIGYFKPIVAADFYQFPVTTPGQNPKANPNYKPGTNGTGGNPRAYYYIDDVVVEKQSALPIRLHHFAAKRMDDKVRLDWQTAMENNNCRFEVERSEDGRNFQMIGSLPGAVNSSATQYYQFTDVRPVSGRSYYRIRQVDCDGKSTLSNVISLNNQSTALSVYPNPVADKLIIDRTTNITARAAIYDLAGRMIAIHTLKEPRETLNVQGLLPGTYIIKVTSETEHYARKFIKK
jgi:hypothetical protein